MKKFKGLAAVLIITAALGMTGCEPAEHVHTEDNGTVTVEPGCFTKGTRTYKCSSCENERTEEMEALGWCETMVDADTYEKAAGSSVYIYFGVFPKNIKAASVTVDEEDTVTMGANTYFKGSDGEWYAKVTANPFWEDLKYSDDTTITEGNTDFFKVEPIKWKVITADYNGSGKALLLAEDMLTASVPYYAYNSRENIRTVEKDTEIYPNNYKYSQIRAYLNGLDYYYDSSKTETIMKTEYTGKGFLQTAFTASAQALIADTKVVNDGESTSCEVDGKVKKADGTEIESGSVETGNAVYFPDFTCADTIDKIFLLSEKEVTTTDYGFVSYNTKTRIRIPTDYAKANCAFLNINWPTDGGDWWIRSPCYKYNFSAQMVNCHGNCGGYDLVSDKKRGVVPALTIALE